MLKIITWLLTKKEARLSKKTAINEELKLYRNLLDEIDKYNYETKGISTFRHYRFNAILITDDDGNVKVDIKEMNKGV